MNFRSSAKIALVMPNGGKMMNIRNQRRMTIENLQVEKYVHERVEIVANQELQSEFSPNPKEVHQDAASSMTNDCTKV